MTASTVDAPASPSTGIAPPRAASQGTVVPSSKDLARKAAARRQVGWFLVAMAGILFTMIVVGGATRLTDSGLSITEWRPVTGTIPPLTAAQWEVEFNKYRQIPEYQQINRGMSLADFKVIYYWEWGHRLLGRVIGLFFALGMIYFALARKLDRDLAWKLGAMFVMGGLQGVLGWYMVMSGLVDRVDVSQYRLVAHLGLAFAIFAFMAWVATDLLAGTERRQPRAVPGVGTAAVAVTGLVYLQVLLGGFVAGLDAGFTYNTWPLMDGSIVPPGLWRIDPWWLNLFENITTVQFVHRMTAYGLVAAVVALYVMTLRRPVTPGGRQAAGLLGLAVLGQMGLGIWTLVAGVPVWLGAAHQGGAVIVLALSIYATYRLTSAPAPTTIKVPA